MPNPVDSSNQVAVIIPLIRTPLGVDFFDFAIPTDIAISIGDLVEIPFRSSTIFGLVAEMKATSQYKDLKSVKTKLPLNLPSSTLGLLNATSSRTFCSRPSVLKAWLRDIPKRWSTSLDSDQKNKRTKKISKAIGAHWLLDSRQAIKEQIKDAINKDQSVLFVCPWKDRIAWWKSEFPNATIMTSDTNDGDYFKAWTSFVKKETSLLITTRIGTWLSSIADIVILDEPENDDHKQDELAPRYDARWLIRWCADRRSDIQVHAFGLTPPLHALGTPPTIPLDLKTIVYHPQGSSSIPLIQADSISNLIERNGPKYIIHPIRGARSSIVCRDCGWIATCPTCHGIVAPAKDKAKCKQCGRFSDLPLTCKQCEGTRLERGLPGIQTLQTRWQKEYSEEEVEWRDISNASLEKPFDQHATVLLTMPRLLAGASEDIRRQERLCVAYRRLAEYVHRVEGQLIIQTTEEDEPLWSDWLKTEGVMQLVETEKRTRAMFKYPPAFRRFKLLLSGSRERAEAWIKQIRTKLPGIEWEGPFPTEQSAARRQQRQVIHGIVPQTISEDQLIQWLTPFAKDAIIDLDPIAFLR